MGQHTHLKCNITHTHIHTKKYIITHTHTHTRVVFLSPLGLVFGYEPSCNVLSAFCIMMSKRLGKPWKHELVFFLAGLFFLSQERKESGRGKDLYGNREQKQTRTETAPVSQCFQNTFPKHVRKNPTLCFCTGVFAYCNLCLSVCLSVCLSSVCLSACLFSVCACVCVCMCVRA